MALFLRYLGWTRGIWALAWGVLEDPEHFFPGASPLAWRTLGEGGCRV